MRTFECKECGFMFGLAADFENMSEEEYKEVTKCPCGAQMEETDYIMGVDLGEVGGVNEHDRE